jgi:hypothetical protein
MSYLPVLTALTAIGGYPDPPEAWKKFTAIPAVQVGALAVLVRQGGATDWKGSFLIALVFIIIITIIKNKEKENYYNPKYVSARKTKG